MRVPLAKALSIFVIVGLAKAGFAQMPDLDAGPEVKKLDWLIGDWTATSTWTMEGMDPMEVEIEYSAKWDGKFISQSTVTDFVFFKMTETMLLGWDPDKKRYSSWAFTNMSSMPRIEHGSLEGDTLTMISEPWLVDGMDESSSSKAVLTKKGDDQMAFTLYLKVGDEDWAETGKATFKRKKAEQK